MRHASKPFRFQSFTLIELLVVIAIIAILAALLTPALRSAKLNALDIKCGQNMRQIHMAIMMYGQDHDQLYPDITWDHQYKQVTILSNYVGNTLDIFHCPVADDSVITDATWGPKFSTNISGTLYYTDYKVGDDATWLLNKPIGSQLRPNMVVWAIDNGDWSPRHRGKANLCFGDGHVEMMTYVQYNDAGSAPEPGSPTGDPHPFTAWGIWSY